MTVKEWTLRAWREGELLVVSAAGIATANSIRTLRAFVRAGLGEHEGRGGVVVDLRDAHLELNTEEWRQAAIDSARAAFKPPIAIVVEPSYFDGAVSYCFYAAESGQRRMAFTELAPALSWAQGRVSRVAQADRDIGQLRSMPTGRLRLVR